MSTSRPANREGFEIALICALPLEFDAVSLIFDEFWDAEGDPYGRASGDYNSYVTGRIGKFNVVVVLLSQMGKRASSSASASIRSSYTRIQLALLVGICGAIPRVENGKKLPLRLGDVVISKSVVQYDFGRQYPDEFVRKNTFEDNLGKATSDLRGLLVTFETSYGLERLRAQTSHAFAQLQVAAAKKGQSAKYELPETPYDDISERAVQGEERKLAPVANTPAIHIGSFASGDMVMKSKDHRDRIARVEGVIAFEMEGAGVWEELPCLIVKGICDYADIRKEKSWQNCAAAAAASVCKAILKCYVRSDKTTTDVPQMPTGRQLGSRYVGKVTGQDVRQGNEMEVRRPGHYTQEGSTFEGEIQVAGSVFQGNKAIF